MEYFMALLTEFTLPVVKFLKHKESKLFLCEGMALDDGEYKRNGGFRLQRF